MLPKRREPVRSGITRAPKRIWTRHRKFVRSHECCVPGCPNGPIEFAHVRTAATAGTGIKSPDWDAVSLCREHHAEQHFVGVETFQYRHKIVLWKLAAEFAKASPDTQMRAVMKEAGIV